MIVIIDLSNLTDLSRVNRVAVLIHKHRCYLLMWLLLIRSVLIPRHDARGSLRCMRNGWRRLLLRVLYRRNTSLAEWRVLDWRHTRLAQVVWLWRRWLLRTCRVTAGEVWVVRR